MHAGIAPPSCEQNSWHTPMKILPCPKLRLRAVTRLRNGTSFQKACPRHAFRFSLSISILWVDSISLACFVAWIADQILRSFFEVISLNKQQYICKIYYRQWSGNRSGQTFWLVFFSRHQSRNCNEIGASQSTVLGQPDLNLSLKRTGHENNWYFFLTFNFA